MPVVQSFGQLQAPQSPTRWSASSAGAVNLYAERLTYAEIYRRQPNVRTCVDFLSRNIAELSYQMFRRVSDTDRVRLVDHDVARWMGKPNPSKTEFRLKEDLVADLGIYFNAYWLKVRYVDNNGTKQLGLVRLPPAEMRVVGGLLPSYFVWTHEGREKEFALSEVVYFNGYDPTNPLMGLSPLETLRRTLAEEAAAGEHRENFWRNSARHEGVIERPVTAKRWDKGQKQEFREQWQERFAGAGAGLVAVLDEGMTFKPNSWSSRESEYVAGRKLTREECAAAYHIPLPMVGILEHATFSNIKEQHKNLYQDTLGPWLQMIDQELERQVLIESDDQVDVYGEFNIREKLQGSFEEQANSIQVLVGRPVMTANEGRARLNLPKMGDDPSADQLAAQQGGPSDASAQPNPPSDGPGFVRTNQPPDPTDDNAVGRVVMATRERQTVRLAKLPVIDRPAAFVSDLDRYNRELAIDLTPIVGAAEASRLAAAMNAATLAQLESDGLLARVVALERRSPEAA